MQFQSFKVRLASFLALLSSGPMVGSVSVIEVPGTWEARLGAEKTDLDGYAWYACLVEIPMAWRDKKVTLALEHVDNASRTYFNHQPIGETGSFPPQYRNGLEEVDEYPVPAQAIRFGALNQVAVLVYDHEGRGGFKGSSPYVFAGEEALPLKGDWLFSPGEEAVFFQTNPFSSISYAPFSKVIDRRTLSRTSMVQSDPGPLSPSESLRHLKVMDGFQVDLVLSEPEIAQPVFMDFDERGRLWVVEYRQYPDPAGLTRVSRDKYWRSVYDKVPPPPPYQIPGADRITIHEDRDRDGDFETHRVFVDGLNICTAVEQGRDGVWVLNPPYLLFYPDLNRDDQPDGDPVVHLAGFGLEDTHSVANSLCWGPDGWLYGAQGSTVTAQIIRPGIDSEPTYSQGQLIWRYHPETRVYEVFAEGGGNAFGVELDGEGRLFSGHNGGNTRGFHYVQGGYHQKGFSKHGPLSNPYAYGYFQPMRHPDVERFTHTFIIYGGGALQEEWDGKLFGVEPLQGRVVVSRITPNGSSFETRDLGYAIESMDPWFRPVDIKAGPDGAIYVADWYDHQVNHYRNHEGQIDASNGRIYRIRDANTPVSGGGILDLETLSSGELVENLSDSNKWIRRESLRLLADRRDRSVLSLLRDKIRRANEDHVLDAFWGFYLSGGFNEDHAEGILRHRDPYVRLWAVRFLGDWRRTSTSLSDALVELAAREGHIEVRSQLACSARRFGPELALPLFKALCAHEEDVGDVYQPLLLWWILEANAETSRSEILSLFQDPAFWKLPMVREHLVERIIRRYAQSGKQSDLLACAALFSMAPDGDAISRLLSGFEEAFQGRSMVGLPDELTQQLAKHAGQSIEIGIKQGSAAAIEQALEVMGDARQDATRRLRYARLLAESKVERALDPILNLLSTTNDPTIQSGLLTGLQYFDNPKVGRLVLAVFPNFSSEIRSAAINLLSRRSQWALAMLDAIQDSGQIQKGIVPEDAILKLKASPVAAVREKSETLWPSNDGSDKKAMEAELARLNAVLSQAGGSPYAGRSVYQNACGVCHRLFEEGASIGPDLTSYQRQDLQSLLLNIVHPNAEIREGYENMMVETRDGRLLTGFLADQDSRVIVLRGLDGENLVLAREDIVELTGAGRSLMPEGLLGEFDEEQIRDLFAYLRSTQPLNE